jgi:hypothetical protein
MTYMLIRYPIGIIVEAVVLAKGRNRMRVAAAGFSDALELRRSGRQWFAPASQPVDFDFLMPSAQSGAKASFTQPIPATRASASAARN